MYGVALEDKPSTPALRKCNRPSRTERARKKACRLGEELAQSTHLVRRLVETNQVTSYAASLQADLNRDLAALAFPTKRTSTPFSSRLPRSTTPRASVSPTRDPSPKQSLTPLREVSVPISPSPPPLTVTRYKKFWSDEGTPSSDISLTGLPTEQVPVSFLGAAKRVSLENRISSPKAVPLENRLGTPDPIDYNSSNPFGFVPSEDFLFDNKPPYTPQTPPYYKEVTPKQPINHYRDPRRPLRRH